MLPLSILFTTLLPILQHDERRVKEVAAREGSTGRDPVGAAGRVAEASISPRRDERGYMPEEADDDREKDAALRLPPAFG